MIVLETKAKDIEAGTLSELLEQVERHVITGVLRANKGNRTQAARMLGVSRQGLYGMLSRHGINVKPAKRKARAKKG